jgi:hypothetical protein
MAITAISQKSLIGAEAQSDQRERGFSPGRKHQLAALAACLRLDELVNQRSNFALPVIYSLQSLPDTRQDFKLNRSFIVGNMIVRVKLLCRHCTFPLYLVY